MANKLKLKDNIQKLVDSKQDIIIRRNGDFNKKDRFPYDTPEEQYLDYRKKGFRIFVCKECDKEFCKHLREEFKQEEVVVDEYNDAEKTEENVFASIDNNKEDYSQYKLSVLRKMFPDIKAVSKEGFINKIYEQLGKDE